ncbi:MAG: GAF domain-containing protein [Jatrophihabitans sp.]|nr:MAG: GAF domain-containing protein [Jatrophihabitans sp.]
MTGLATVRAGTGNVQRSLLRLLAGDATAEHLSAAVDAALAGSPLDRAAAEELREDLRFSLLIRSELVQRRGRERELSALFETAGDLASIRDVEQVLRAIVARARLLLESETAYLMLIDTDAGDTYMRVGAGTITRQFMQVRLPLGAGLGGLVAQDRCPYSTPDYLVDHRFDHHPDVDSAVGDEGLVAILGVPLTVGDRLLGVLFAADRHERSYTQQQIALLASMANHAAVAIENARLLRDTQLALRELAEAKAVIESHSREVERSVDAHERLTGVVLQGGGLTEVAATLGEVLDGSVMVVAPTGQLLACGGGPVDDFDARVAGAAEATASSALWHELLGLLGAAEHTGRTVRGDLGGGWLEPRWIAPVLAGGEPLAYLVLASRRSVAGVDIRTLERAAQVTALLLLRERASAEAEERARGDLLNDLLDALPPDPESVRRRCALLGLDPDSRYVLVVARAEGSDPARVLAAAAALARAGGGLAAERGGDAVLLLPGAEPCAAARSVREQLGRRLHTCITVAADEPRALLENTAGSYRRMRRCVQVVLGLGRAGAAVTGEQIGFFGLLFDESATRLERFVSDKLTPVLDYDEEHRTDLVPTLAEYLAAGRRHRVTAERMHIHPNTLYQRLQRISELSGIDFEDADQVLELHLALRLRQLQLSP